ncbi:histone chaperone asf1-like isoform X2 [Hetaerina americana]|uniref:histone chaperone asf1-like n=1 Tax=Hetaerina americana TaxID=62018 RepID=UPI003A7F4204
MAKVHVCNVVVLDNPSPFLNPFQFEITFDCIEDLQEDLEWRIIYVGSAECEELDQVLETVYVGPVSEGRHMFVFQAEPPDPLKIPVADVVGVTVVLLTCSYRGQEFMRVGYYVNNDYEEPELRENPPACPLFDKLHRNLLATNPRVTNFKIDWDDTEGQESSLTADTDVPATIQRIWNEPSNHLKSNQNSKSPSESLLRLSEPES